MIVERCDQCPLDELDHYRRSSDAGRLLDRVLQLDFAAGSLRVSWDEVTAEEVKALQILREERVKHQGEKHEEEREQMADEGKIRQLQEQTRARRGMEERFG